MTWTAHIIVCFRPRIPVSWLVFGDVHVGGPQRELSVVVIVVRLDIWTNQCVFLQRFPPMGMCIWFSLLAYMDVILGVWRSKWLVFSLTCHLITCSFPGQGVPYRRYKLHCVRTCGVHTTSSLSFTFMVMPGWSLQFQALLAAPQLLP